MDLPAGLEVIHQPVRLRVMTLLYRHGDVGFSDALRTLALTPGNLESHIKRLAQDGLVESRRALMAGTFEVRLRITPAGAERFTEYLDLLDEFLGAARSQ